MDALKQKWLDAIGTPSAPRDYGKAVRISSFSHPEFEAEWYSQTTLGGRPQRVLMLFPRFLVGQAPAVAVPFYYPEAMLGYDPATGEVLERFCGIEMMLQLVRRGYIVASADAYHLTYIESEKARGDFSRWQDAADALRGDHPHFSGIGKLVDDTSLLIDLMVSDARVDSERIGIAGHSLGGKMAFYTGCLDSRVRAILASDFGICWHQTNWESDWYWGKDAARLSAEGFDHAELLGIAEKPFCLIAGQYDNEESYAAMCRARGYSQGDERLHFIHHATGHRPPLWALSEGYDFLDRYLKR